ncbi:MAG TPA: aminopeptidase P family N-terminal domain-containing protein, partial [Gaiellaceae bacterium]|nr:aminopeptidase P family N-terminal domain-containing protein [Gaiellaceae bacterium]
MRALMAEEGLDALVVRAPDNVLYLTNFWGMKGYDACVFPRDGEPVLICLEASAEDAARTAWTEDVRLVRGYAADDPRPVPARTLDAAVEAARGFGRVGLERAGRRRPRVGFVVAPDQPHVVGPRGA